MSNKLPTFYVLAMVGHLENVIPKFTQMPDRITNVEFTTVSPTIANTMLPAGIYSSDKNCLIRSASSGLLVAMSLCALS